MKIVQINSVCGEGSTGKICLGIKEKCESTNTGVNTICIFGAKIQMV